MNSDIQINDVLNHIEGQIGLALKEDEYFTGISQSHKGDCFYVEVARSDKNSTVDKLNRMVDCSSMIGGAQVAGVERVVIFIK